MARYARLSNELSGIEDYDNPSYLPVRRSEYDAELYYGFAVTPAVTLRPNLQFIKAPGGVEQVDNALVAGLKMLVRF